MTSMIAATYESSGSSDVLRVGGIERPTPGCEEVLVRIAVSGVNPSDWKTRAGIAPAAVDGVAQVPGQDGAGTIDAVGEGVDPARIGERVWVYFASWQRRWGTAAQWTVVPGAQAVRLPESASDDLGASLGIPALTAYYCLFADGSIEGRQVLVHGGAGAVGHAAIELARWAGARVIATVSSEEKAEIARQAGAEEVVDYRAKDAAEQLRAAAPDGVDRIVEVALRTNISLDLASCAPQAVIISYADDRKGDTKLPVVRLLWLGLMVRFMLIYTVPPTALAEAVAGVTEALEAGALTTLPIHRFGLEQIAEAHDAVEAGTVGKVVVDIP